MPAALVWLRESERGTAWLAELPRLVAECCASWQLETGPAFPLANVSLALAATRSDGSAAVLKLQYPHRESLHEAAALRCWNGEGAVRLLQHDEARNALLLERARPGAHLSELAPDKAIAVLCELLPRLWKPAAAPFASLADEAAAWAVELPSRWERAGRPYERALLDAALGSIGELAGSQGEQVLLHQDLHAGNVLRAEREPWLAIDPKPLVGEREFGVAPIVRGAELGHARALVIGRLDGLCGELGLERERARGWTLAQTLAWAIDDDGADAEHVEVARWMHQAG